MGISIAVCLGIGVAFFAIGAWPVIGFLGLDVLILYGAFKLSYRSGQRYEDVSVSRSAIQLKQVSPSGRAKWFRWNPFGTRFEVSRHEEIGITRMALANRSEQVEIGSFLNPADKESFSEAFKAAINTAKR